MNTISLSRFQKHKVLKGGAQTVLLRIGSASTGTTVELSLEQAMAIRAFLEARISPSTTSFSGVELK